MGIWDSVKDTVDDAVDAGQEAAGDISEGVSDVADEVSQGDVGGAVDEASDTVEDVASGSRDTGSNDSGGSSSSGSSSSGSSVSVSTGGGSSGSSSSSSGSSGGGSSSGGSGGGSSGGSSGGGFAGAVSNTVDDAVETGQEVASDVGETVSGAVDQGVDKLENAYDTDLDQDGRIGNSPFQNRGSSGGSGSGVDVSVSDKTQVTTSDPYRAEEIQENSGENVDVKVNAPPGKMAEYNRDKAQEFDQAVKKVDQRQDRIDQQLEKVRNAPRDAKFTYGGETVQASELQDRLENRKDELASRKDQYESTESDLRNQALNQEFRATGGPEDIQNLIESGGRSTLSVEEQARKGNLDNLKLNVDVPGTGSLGEFTLTGLPARTAASFDTFTSDQGFEQLSTAAPWVDKSGAQVIKENVVESRREARTDPGFDASSEAIETLSSPLGLTAGAGAAGAAFKGGTTALAAQGGRAATAAKGIEIGAGAAGAAYTASEGAESARDFQEGNNLEGTENLLKLGSETVGFAGGARAAARGLSPRVSELPGGSRSIRGEGTNRLTETSRGEFEGSGQFEGRFNVEVPRISERLGIAESGQGTASARFNTFSSESGGQAVGRLSVDVPGRNTQSRPFEAVNIRTGSTETPSGSDVALSRDIVRTESEGPLFRSTNTRTGSSRTIRESDQNMEVQSLQDGIIRSENARVVESASRTADDSGDLRAIGETTSIIQNSPRGSGSGGAGSGSGGRISGSGSSGGSSGSGGQIQSGRTRSDFQAEDFDFSSQVGRGVQDTIGISAGTAQGGSGSFGTSADLADDVFQGQAQETRGSGSQVQAGPDLSLGQETGSVERLSQDTGGQSTRDPVSELSSGVTQVDQDLDQGTGNPGTIFDDPASDQRNRESPGQSLRERNVPEEVQRNIPESVQRTPPREEQVPGQELGIFQASDQDLDETAVQRSRLRQQERITPRSRPPSVTGRPSVPGRPQAGPFGGSVLGDSSDEGGSGEIDGQFAPSLEGIAFGVESSVQQGEDPTLTGLEVRGVPSQQEESQNEGNSNDSDSPRIL